MKNLKIAFRHLLKNKVVTIINVSGLTLGILVSLLLFAYVQQERTTDRFIPDYNNIQIITRANLEDSQYEQCISRPMVKIINDELGHNGIITFAKKTWTRQAYIMHNQQKFKIESMIDADSNFFKVFALNTLYGNLDKSLNVTNSIVITKKLANKIFGNTNPVGQTIVYNTNYQQDKELVVTAVLDELPQNTALKFDAVVPDQLSEELGWYKSSNDSWGGMNYAAFWKLNPNTDIAKLNADLHTLSQKHLKESQLPDLTLKVKPFKNNYFDTAKVNPVYLSQGNVRMLFILSAIAMLIMLIACINYINLSTAQREKRDKGIAIVKIMGGSRLNVFHSFVAEALIMLAVVSIIIFLISPFSINVLNSIMNTSFTSQLLWQPFGIMLFVGLLLFTFIVTGVLPGLIYNRTQALELLKSRNKKQGSTFWRNMLPIFQFTISIALITCLIVMRKQNNMMLNSEPGFAKENVVFSSTNKDISRNINSFVNEIKNISGVKDVTFADAVLGDIQQNWGTTLSYKGESKDINFSKLGVAPNYFDFFDLKIKQGSGFLRDTANFEEVIFNEAAMKSFGIEDAEGALVMQRSVIKGVAENFNFSSLHTSIEPLAFFNNGKTANIVFIKLASATAMQHKQTIDAIASVWNSLSPNLPFEVQFLDKTWQQQYSKEIQFQSFFDYASFISIFLACLGLFGLSLFMTERRIKEVGIRKVNGATIGEILALLNTSFIKWILIAFVIATPIAYFAMNRWLQSFAYKTALSWWIFALAGIIALAIALLTVSWHSWRAASRNPVEALRYE